MARYIITVMGGKSGAGCSIVASNLATTLHQDTKSSTLLLDLNLLSSGDLGLLMGAKDLRPVTELLPVAHKLHERSIKSYITKHKSGIYLLPGITDPRQAGQLASESFENLLGTLKKSFSFIVVDAGAHINAANFLALRHSSTVLMVVTPEIMVINQALNSIRNLVTLQYPQEMIQLLVNRYNPKGTITKSVIQSKFRHPVLATLPEQSEELTHSIHQNIPIVKSDPRCEFSRGMQGLANLMFSSGALKPVKGLGLRANGFPLVHLGSAPANDSRIMTGHTLQSSPRKQRIDALEYDRFSDLKMQVHHKLIEVLNLKGINTAELSAKPEKLAELKEQVRDAVAKIVQEQPGIRNVEERQQVSKQVLDEALGLGPLEDILGDPSVSEIMVNRKDQIYVERNGKIILSDLRFTSDKHLLAVIERIVAPVGRRIDEKTPMVDARLKDGSRVHAIIPPLSVQGPMLTIRKFGQHVAGYQDLVKFGTLTKEMALFLKACVQARLNIVISGGTGTGKTTLLNILGTFIPENERIITVEDSAELNLPQEHVGRLEARPANLQGEGAITIRELVRNTLRMRPDRIIIGECRGAEALDMLQAMNTGHDGSLTTLHSNAPRDCVSRLETLVMFAGMDLPSKAIRDQVSSAIDLIVQLNRFSDGSRKVTHITEVTGMEGQTITLQDIFVFRQKGLDKKGRVVGNFSASGLIPTFMERFKEQGIKVPSGMFGESGSK